MTSPGPAGDADPVVLAYRLAPVRDPHRSKSRTKRAFDIAIPAVTHHHGIRRLCT